jgi:F0F1-type ATP synthase membrane subunit a
MPDQKQIGRLAMRAEGSLWNAYYAMHDTMTGAIFLGSIRLASVVDNPARKQAFMDMMRDAVGDTLKEVTGTSPTWGGAAPAPEHERGGHG